MSNMNGREGQDDTQIIVIIQLMNKEDDIPMMITIYLNEHDAKVESDM